MCLQTKHVEVVLISPLGAVNLILAIRGSSVMLRYYLGVLHASLTKSNEKSTNAVNFVR